ANLIDQEIKILVEEGLTLAKKLLTEHKDKLHILAEALLEYETLSGEEIKTLLSGMRITRPNVENNDDTIQPSSLPQGGNKASTKKKHLPKLEDGTQQA